MHFCTCKNHILWSHNENKAIHGFIYYTDKTKKKNKSKIGELIKWRLWYTYSDVNWK